MLAALLSAEGQETPPPPHPRTPSQSPGHGQTLPNRKMSWRIAHWLPPRPLFRSLQGLKACISRGDSRGYEEGAWQHFFFFRRASYQCDKGGPKEGDAASSVALSPAQPNRLVHPAKSASAAARQFAVSGQRFAKQTAPSCISPSCSLEFLLQLRALHEQGALSWPSPTTASARQNA